MAHLNVLKNFKTVKTLSDIRIKHFVVPITSSWSNMNLKNKTTGLLHSIALDVLTIAWYLTMQTLSPRFVKLLSLRLLNLQLLNCLNWQLVPRMIRIVIDMVAVVTILLFLPGLVGNKPSSQMWMEKNFTIPPLPNILQQSIQPYPPPLILSLL